MHSIDLSLREDYWESLEITENDINFLYNYLIDLEHPASLTDLVKVLVDERVNQILVAIEKRQQQNGRNYLPKESYDVGEELIFPAFDWTKGKVISKRAAVNPELSPFNVIEVEFTDGMIRSLAAELSEHKLNEPVQLSIAGDLTDPEIVLSKHKIALSDKLQKEIAKNPDLVSIAQKWYPKALLVDVNIGYLNLAEALLDMEGGGPLTTDVILKQIDLPTDVNPELTAFSLNYAMHEDDRFDEVGATGEVLWYLQRLEPEWVKNSPGYLQYKPIDYDQELIREMKSSLSRNILDEFEELQDSENVEDEATIGLIFPHWRSGALPMADEIAHLFPTALESPRVQFTFVDGNTGKRFSGWVVRPFHYIGGLSDWYAEQGVVPGSLIHIKKGDQEGEVIIQVGRQRSARDWVRTALVGGDGGIVFAMLKQLVSTDMDERLAIYIPDREVLDKYWTKASSGKYELTKIIIHMMRELVKLNPQGHVHLEELYAAVNLRFRCPPGLILSILMDEPWASHLGDLYFNFDREHLEK
jgi:hypothetical protein